MAIDLEIPQNNGLKPVITVFGVGGAGGNAVNNMITANLEGVKFVVANTDAQALENSKADLKIQLGSNATKGLGAGAAPEIGMTAAEESTQEIEEVLETANMLFITAGMGGGTGTGAAPVVARLARAKGILTVGVVTKPFNFEGAHRMRVAEQGLTELQNYVDTLIVIPNQNLFRIANERTTFADAFKMADDVLHAGVRGVTDLITMPGLINLDFADIVTVMNQMGKAMMGTGEASGDSRAVVAAEAAISNPLLDHSSMQGAGGVLINITGGMDMTLFEVDEAANRIREEVDGEANIIFGSTFNPNLEGVIRITVVATGIDLSSVLETEQFSSKNIKKTPQENNQPEESLEDTEIQTEKLENIEINQYASGRQENKEELQVESKANSLNRDEESNYNQEETSINNHYLHERITNEPKVESKVKSNTNNSKVKKKSLFSRMASSLGFSSNDEACEELENDAAANDVEVPAFLRRKK